MRRSNQTLEEKIWPYLEKEKKIQSSNEKKILPGKLKRVLELPENAELNAEQVRKCRTGERRKENCRLKANWVISACVDAKNPNIGRYELVLYTKHDVSVDLVDTAPTRPPTFRTLWNAL